MKTNEAILVQHVLRGYFCVVLLKQQPDCKLMKKNDYTDNVLFSFFISTEGMLFFGWCTSSVRDKNSKRLKIAQRVTLFVWFVFVCLLKLSVDLKCFHLSHKYFFLVKLVYTWIWNVRCFFNPAYLFLNNWERYRVRVRFRSLLLMR